MSGLILVFVNSETYADRSAVPALGPSLPMLPSGMCTWMSRSVRNCSSGVLVIPSSYAWLLTHESAICALSRMTSPSLPVSWMLPFPGIVWNEGETLSCGDGSQRCSPRPRSA